MKSSRLRLTLIALAVAFVLAGCATRTAERLGRLELGMTPDQVTAAMGAPHTISGGARDTEGHEIRVWEYALIRKNWTLEYYALYFLDGQLERWGPATDIQADIRAEVRIDGGQNE